MEKHKARRTLGTCCAAHTLHDGLSDVTYVLLPLLAQTFGLSLAQVGLIRAAHRAAMATFQIPAGLIAERFGERNLLAVGTAITGLAFLALGFAEGFWVILAALFFAGVGSAVQHPLASTIISHAYSDVGRRGALGTYNFFGDVGKFAFGGIVSLCLLAGISWQAPVVGFGIVGVITAAAIFLVIVDTTHAHRTKPMHAAPAPLPQVDGWGIRSPQGFTALCLIEILDSSTRTGFLTFIAFLLIAKGLPEGWAVLAVPLILVGGMAGKLACGFLAERVGIVRTIIITEVATGAGILLTLALPGIAAFFVLPLIGVVLQGTSSVLYATIGDLVQKERLPRVFGLFYTLGSLCGIAAPLGYGLMGDVFGVENAIAAMGIAVLITVPLCALLRPALGVKPMSI
ncbi:MAG: MFS transporter [Betaproteobacteria bacterium]|nr:MFS transporter [Betaproteobacteria bacterium]